MLSFHFTSLVKACELWHVKYNDKVYIAFVKLILKMIPGSSEHEKASKNHELSNTGRYRNT